VRTGRPPRSTILGGSIRPDRAVVDLAAGIGDHVGGLVVDVHADQL
jgi:hypothetical protein